MPKDYSKDETYHIIFSNSFQNKACLRDNSELVSDYLIFLYFSFIFYDNIFFKKSVKILNRIFEDK